MNPIRVLKYIKQLLTDIKGETDSKAVMVREFNTSLTSMDRSSRQKFNREPEAWNNTLDQIDLFDSYRAFNNKKAEYMIFSSAYGTFSQTDPMLGNKSQ